MTTPPITCPVCKNFVPTQDGKIASHNQFGGETVRLPLGMTVLHVCPGSAQPIATAGEAKREGEWFVFDETGNQVGTTNDPENTACFSAPGYTFHRDGQYYVRKASLVCISSPAPASAEREEIRRPTLLTSCAICAEDYSWPLDEVFWCALTAVWICRECWNESHGDKGPTAKAIVDSSHQLARAQDKARIAGLEAVLCDIVKTDDAAIAQMKAMGISPEPETIALTERARAELNRNTEKEIE